MCACKLDSKAQQLPFRSTTVLLHFYKFLKSTLLIVLLKAVKLTEVGRLFHALKTLLAKKFILTVQSLYIRGLYSLYACPLVPVN